LSCALFGRVIVDLLQKVVSMKNTFALLGGICFATSAVAAPGDTYLALSGSRTFPKSIESNAGVRADLRDGYGIAGAVGRNFGGVRGELEVAYKRNNLGSATGFGFEAQGRGRASALSGMANVYLDPTFSIGPVQPYIGGGIGVARFRATDIDVVGLPAGGPITNFGPVDASKTGFAYQAMAGVGIPLSENATFTIGYRYFATPGADVNVPLFNDVRINGLKVHSGEAGIRFAF